MLFAKGRLHIIPDAPDVVVYGSPREARSAIISGRIVYATRAPRAVASLVVRFRPKQEELFNPAMSVANQEEISSIVVKDGHVSASAAALPFDELAGQQEWRFSISIPGSVGETVFTPSAFVAYELAAELRTSLAWSPFARVCGTVPVAVKRVPAEESLWAALAAEPLDVAADWRGQLELSARAASRIVHDAQAYHVTGVIRPLAKGVRLLRAAFELREAVDGPFDCHDGPRTHVTRCSHELCVSALGTCQGMQMRTAFAPTMGPGPGVAVDQEIQVAGTLSVPSAYSHVQYDVSAGPIRVSHELVFVAQVVEETGEVHSVRLSTGVYMLPSVAPLAVDLPRYEHVAKDVLLVGSDVGAALWTCRDGTPPPAYSPESCAVVAVPGCSV